MHNTARCQNIAIFQLYSFIYLLLSIFSAILSLLIKNMVQCKQEYHSSHFEFNPVEIFIFIFRLFSNEHPNAYSCDTNDLTENIKYRPYEGVWIKARAIQTRNVSEYPDYKRI